MGTGYGAGEDPPPSSYYFELGAGTYYEMIHPDAWHAEFPYGVPAVTVTVSGKPWPRQAPKSPYKLLTLSRQRKFEILQTVAKLF